MIPNNVLDKVIELGVLHCLINRPPNRPIEIAYIENHEVKRELFKGSESHESFLYEVHIVDGSISLTPWPL
jgi:hypothetical protein